MITSLSNRPHRGLVPLLLSGILAATAATAQEEEPLVTDRPDFTESALSVDKGRVQLESGVTYQEVEEATAWGYGEVLVRIGVSKKIEVRVGINSYLDIETPFGDASGMDNSTLGAKFELMPAAQSQNWACRRFGCLGRLLAPNGVQLMLSLLGKARVGRPRKGNQLPSRNCPGGLSRFHR